MVFELHDSFEFVYFHSLEVLLHVILLGVITVLNITLKDRCFILLVVQTQVVNMTGPIASIYNKDLL